jgi:dipeptidyl aminopeptidase/acylaminoacyl peptidase
MRKPSLLAASLVIGFGAATIAQTGRGGAPGLTIDALIGIRHPSRAIWSPDGQSVAFVWDRAGVQNAWAVSLDGRPPSALTTFADGLIDGLSWSADGRSVLFARGRDLWQVPRAGGEPQPIWTTPEAEDGIVLSPDGTQAAFERSGDIWVRRLRDLYTVQLTRTSTAELSPIWSPEGTRIAFTISSASRREEAPDYAGAKILFTWLERQPTDVGVVPATGGAVVRLGSSPATESAPRWIDPGHVVLQRVSEDLKTREVIVADASTGEAKPIHSDVDSKWWSLTYLNPEPVPSPNGRWVAFVSDRDGWDHLYVVRSEGGTVHQITKGRYEVSRLRWSPDGTQIAFDTNEGESPGRRQVAVATIAADPAQTRIETLTSGRGTNTEPLWSPDQRRVLYQHTDPATSADLFVIDAQPGAVPRRLTDSMPREIDKRALTEPQFVRYASPDGSQVPAYLFVPAGLDRARRHPAIVWVHGDGVTQNYEGWHVRRDYAVYYSFHQYLAARGYVVLAVDYRGSIGYGRDWRQGHFRDLGGKDYEDVAAGAAYLKTLGFVDPDRIGVWGLSYGGFMTLQALTVTPELFRCGIDVAGVVDWRDWHKDPDGPWIKGRMGSPSDNPDLYRRTAPIERVERIVRPLMVLHGTADVNVPFLESVRLVDALTKAGKHVEFMIYPGEFHYFHRAHVLRDAWQRVERFFDTHLRPASKTSS